MAWQPYVTELMKNGNLEHGAVIGAADAMIWAADPGFTLSSYETDVAVDTDKTEKVQINEPAIILNVFQTKGQVTNKGGIRINGTKYVCTTFDEDENACYMKSETGGACAIKTNQCILIGTFDTKKNAKQCAGNCNNDVAKLAKGLRDSGY